MPNHDTPPVQAPGMVRSPNAIDFTTDFTGADRVARESTVAPASFPLASADRYQLIAEIARGGMGVVWSAADTTLGREVAVKVLQERFAPDSTGARRFADEARITAQLQHPAIPPVHDYGLMPDGRPFLAMKLIKGRTLDELLRERRNPTTERGRFVAVFEQICQAVAYAHAHQVIHRDLKPSNIMVGTFGEVQVMDWGLAKIITRPAADTADHQTGEKIDATVIHGSDVDGSDASSTQAGSILGTLTYMAPEQAAGEIGKIGPPSDVFGLGAILSVILTGQPPYAGTDTAQLRVMAVRGDLTDCLARLDRCGAEPELLALCKRCLAFDPADRPQNADAVAKEVAGWRAATEERTRIAEKERAAAEVKVGEQKKRRRWQRAVAAAVVLIFALVGGGAWWIDHQASKHDKERAVKAEQDRQEAAAALAHAEEVLAAGDFAAAGQPLAVAESRLGSAGPPDFVARLATAKRDRDLIRGLREIEELNYSPGGTAGEPAEIARRYQDKFASYGLDVRGEKPALAVETVQASRVSAALKSGLSEWLRIDPKGPHVRELLDRLDSDPDRTAIRAAIQVGDKARLSALVVALDGSKVPTWFAASVGFDSLVPQEEGVRLMAAAWRTHPSDYVLAYRCGRRLWGTQRIDEMLGWAKVAVALRPENPFAHGLLGMAWQAKHNWPEAEASARRAIELGRNYPRHAWTWDLANILLDKGDYKGAEANYRAALAVNPTAGLYFNLGLVHQKQEDFVEAEDWFRKAVAADPKQTYFREVLDNTIQVRKYLEKVAAGQLTPPNAVVAVRATKVPRHPSRRQYTQAVKLYSWAFEKDPAIADDLANSHRYDAARSAVLAAAGQDKEMPVVEPAEWSRLTGLALKWLRADLALMTAQAKDSQRQRPLGKWLARWQEDPDLASVREPSSLTAMTPADADAWRSLWRDVDSLIASLSK
jgi:eukaryotic-like serine/threonine-protein kinase